ncbi:MAG: SDR family oxidoreductase [Oscillospiraceae bacterium]|nr:SDR family oxidoreductase [Oscillospiraceae bacterium]
MNTAIITGGTGAIGKALVAEFAKDYRVVFTWNNNEEDAITLSDRYGATAVQCDISRPEEIKKLEPYIKGCSLLINNAGISQIKLFTDITDEDWSQMIGVNLSGVFYLTRAVVPEMVHNKAGSIINISSVWGVHGASCEVHYSAAKAGVIGLTKALSKELGPSDIRVNCIAPGVIDSRMNAHLNADELMELTDSTPLGRMGTPEEIAHAARFFEQNKFATGQILGVDGGFY